MTLAGPQLFLPVGVLVERLRRVVAGDPEVVGEYPCRRRRGASPTTLPCPCSTIHAARSARIVVVLLVLAVPLAGRPIDLIL